MHLLDAFIVSIQALIEKNIIDLKQIHRYVCCSGSSIIGVLLSCGYDLNVKDRSKVK